MSDFARPKEGFRFAFGGIKLSSAPDALPPNKYAMAVNVRAYSESHIQSRPGQSQLFTTDAHPITDIGTYSMLGEDNAPRFLLRGSTDKIWFEGTLVTTLANSGTPGNGASMIPFRPNASVNSWMYVANGTDYQKFSPLAGGVVTPQKVGIAEPQTAPEAAIAQTLFYHGPSGPTYTNAGTAGATAGGTSRVIDVAGVVFADPASGVGGGDVVYSIQVAPTVAYQRLMTVTVGVPPAVVLDVFSALPVALTLSGIYYFTGSTGRCILVINSLAGQGGGDSIYNPLLLASLRRGAIIKIAAEYALVLSVSQGPDGSFAVETSTTNTHTTADTITIVPAIQVINPGHVPAPGNTITDFTAVKTYAVTVGVGTETTAAGLTNPFVNSGLVFQEDDNISMGFRVDVPSNVTEFKLLFDVDDGTFTKNFYYYTVRASDIASAIANATTQLGAAQTVAQRALIDEENAISSGNQGTTFSGAQAATGANQWGQIVFSIRELTRVGSDLTKSLLTFTAFQVLWNVTGTVNVAMDGFFTIIGGYQADVGDVGAPYLYRVRPRSKVTGVVGNPSPATRYGVNPRRESVVVSLPSASYDTQIDTWDIERYGGTVTSWRFIGSTPSSNPTFIDNYSDEAAGEGAALEFDNFEPWPVVDVPNNGSASIVNGTIAIISSTDADTARYLPGTLVQLGGLNAYTLRVRPALITGSTYRLEFIENAGVGASVLYNIQEPLLANQHLPYMWGPDVNGTVFAVGDSFNPGKLYFAKGNNPDSAPDSYNVEVCPPSEPLLGGEILDGLGLVASGERWWALYSQPDNPLQRYNFVQQPFPRGLAAPYGHCNDGKSVYWWAKDGIYSSSKGSLTDEDLFNLFPHEGVAGVAVTYKNVTVQPPAYNFAGAFRLTHSNGYLYAIYKDINQNYQCLVYDIRRNAWSVDSYNPAVSCVYHPEQQAGSLAPGGSSVYAETVMGSINGSLSVQSPNTNDLGGAIVCTLATREFDGGDIRAPKQWGDFFLDLLPSARAGVSVTPMSLGAGVTSATVIATSALRGRKPISVGGQVVSDFLGLFLAWTDDFTAQAAATQLFAWQPSYDIQPARTVGWTTFGSSFNLQGFGHIRQIAIAWVSTATITLTITAFDGQSPQVITIPSSGGVYKKQLFPLTANKGQLFVFAAASSAPFQIFEDDLELYVGQWGRSGPYQVFKSFGGAENAQSPI